jgi:hypothetical protein
MGEWGGNHSNRKDSSIALSNGQASVGALSPYHVRAGTVLVSEVLRAVLNIKQQESQETLYP